MNEQNKDSSQCESAYKEASPGELEDNLSITRADQADVTRQAGGQKLAGIQPRPTG